MMGKKEVFQMMMNFTVTVKNWYGLSTFTMQAPSYQLAWSKVWDVMRVSGIKGQVISIKTRKNA